MHASPLLTAFVLVLAGGTVGMESTAVVAADPSVLFVTGDSSSVPAPDQPLIERLGDSGFVVDLVDDDVASSASGHDLVLISTTVAPYKIGDSYATTPVPLVTWEPSLYDDLGLTSNAASGQTPNTTTLDIADPTHELAAGLASTVDVTAGGARQSHGEPGPEATVVAVETSSSRRPVTFSYDTGAAMHEGIAPARRVATFLTADTTKTWTADANALFDAAVSWALATDDGSGGGTTNRAPVVDAGPDLTTGVGVPIEIAGVVDDDGLPVPQPAVSWSGAPGVDFSSPTTATTTATFARPGTFTLTLSADDTEFSDSDEVSVTVTGNDGPPAGVDVLWITGDTKASFGEQPAVDRLEAAGITVDVVADSAATVSDVGDKDLIVITGTIAASSLDPALATARVPLLTWEPPAYEVLGFTDAGNQTGQKTTSRTITITDASHPLAADLPAGPVEVLGSNKPVSWAAPGGDAAIVATQPGDATRATVFAYDTGDQMADGSAPSRRVGFLTSYSGPRQLTDAGWAMWDAAVAWLLDSPDLGVPPTADIDASPRSGRAPLDVAFDGSGSTDPDDEIASYAWDFGDGGGSDAVAATHTYVGDGSYTAVLTVTDTAGNSASDSVVIDVTGDQVSWAYPDIHYRVPISISTGSQERTDHVAATSIDFTALFASLGGADPSFDPNSLRLVEVDGAGGDTAFQFDPDADFDATTNAAGELLILLVGTTPASTERDYELYFDTEGQGHTPLSPDPLIDTSTGVTDEGRNAVRIATPSGDWWFDLNGGGFSSLDDVDGNDWISFSDAAGSAGKFRGIPNAVHPEGYFHPGNDGVSSSVTASGPLRSTIQSISDDGGYTTEWYVYPSYAEMVMSRASGDYWFLYEGTPGGTLDVATDTVVRSDGTEFAASATFVGDIDDDEWAYFTDRATDRSLWVSHREDDAVDDSYRPLDDEMTVFGFGRGAKVDTLMSATPQTFAVGLVDSTDFTAVSSEIAQVDEPTPTDVGPIEALLPGTVHPTATATSSTTAGTAPLSVSFDGSTSTADGSIDAFAWEFGDGSAGTGMEVDHVYQSDGVFVATLTVTDDAGLTDTTTITITVGLDDLERITDGLITLYEFDAGNGAVVEDTSGNGAPLDLTIADPDHVTRLPGGGVSVDEATTISSDGPAQKVVDAVGTTDEITIEAWVRTTDLDQNGPARIVSQSESANERNFMLGQGVYSEDGDRIETRLRTTTTDDNGRPALRTGEGSFGTDLTHIVYTRADDGTATTYLDGRAVATDLIDGDLSNWNASMPLQLANEADGSRPWLGEYHLVAIYARGFDKADVCTNRSVGAGHATGNGNSSPLACVIADTGSTTASAEVMIDASLSRDLDGSIVEYRWNFGDGSATTTTVPRTTHQYAGPGNYTVQLVIVDDDGATDSDRTTVEVTSDGNGDDGGAGTGPVSWTHIASPDPLLPDPRPPTFDDQQTASLVADLDNDGDNDFVIAARKPPADSIVWYEFIDAATGWVPHPLEDDVLRVEAGGDVFDVDGDGDIDIVFGRDGTGNQIWWWENPGGPGDDATGLWTRHLVKDGGDDKHHDLQFGDVDGDGASELVFWNQQPDNRLMVAEIPDDPAAGPWPTQEIFRTTSSSEGLDIVDIDLDGVDDIVGGGFWFERRPDGTYIPHPIDPDYTFSRSAVGQLVAGGRPEVVIDSGDAIDPLNWYEWNDATNSWVEHQLLAVSTYGHSLRVEDVDGDGNDDIFSAEMMSPFDPVTPDNPDAPIRIFYGDGDGNFELQVVATGFDNHESRLADLDADGDIDILGKPYRIGSPGVDVWLNDGADPFGRWDRRVLDDPAPWTPIFVEHADLDGDGFDDVVTGGWWYRNPGAGGGDWTRRLIGAPLHNMAAVGDLDGDGDIDVIGTAWKTRSDSPNSEFSWASNDGSGDFTIFSAVTTGDGPFLQGATIAQLEPSGPLELVLSWNTGAPGTKTIVVPDDLADDPDQAPWDQRTLSDRSEGEEVVADDLDGDGDTDVFLGSTWLNNGPDDTWSIEQAFSLGSGEPDRIVLTDVDGDGRDDAVIGNGHDPNGELSWYERPANLTQPWTQHLIDNLVNPQSVDVADLDGDGDPDVVVGEHNLDDLDASQLLIYENTGDGSDWIRHVVHVGDEHHDGAQLVDLDGDGDLDIISIGFIQGRVVVYRNGSIFDLSASNRR